MKFFILFFSSLIVPPVIPSPGTELQCGQKLNLSCTTGDALPSDLELKWIPPEKKRYSPGPDPNLTIASVGMEHNGKWTCELWQKGSKSRLVSAVMTLKVGEHRKRVESRKYDISMTLWLQSCVTATRLYML